MCFRGFDLLWLFKGFEQIAPVAKLKVASTHLPWPKLRLSLFEATSLPQKRLASILL